jgi:hypothetical protein
MVAFAGSGCDLVIGNPPSFAATICGLGNGDKNDSASFSFSIGEKMSRPRLQARPAAH